MQDISDKLEGTAQYVGLLLVPANGFGQGFFFPEQKMGLLCCFGLF